MDEFRLLKMRYLASSLTTTHYMNDICQRLPQHVVTTLTSPVNMLTLHHNVILLGGIKCENPLIFPPVVNFWVQLWAGLLDWDRNADSEN